MTRQETINKAIDWALAIANNSAHGYDQANRWGPNYDCSSFVISAWEQAGVPVKSKGATYTGNMYTVFLSCGFVDVSTKVNRDTGVGLQTGDVLLYHNYNNDNGHTEMYVGDGKNVKASINEKGTVTGGQSGDQSGREIYVGNYYNYPWSSVLRYVGDDSDHEPEPEPTEKTCSVKIRNLRKGCVGEDVVAMQVLLIRRGFSVGWYGSDGEFGAATESALKQYQSSRGIIQDGICGVITWNKLINSK